MAAVSAGVTPLAVAVRVALRALKLGAAYGVKIRVPHALVMTLLFGKDRHPATVWSKVATLAWEHARNLAYFAGAYKFLLILLRSVGRLVARLVAGTAGDEQGGPAPTATLPGGVFHGVTGAVAGAAAGYLVWSPHTSLNYQILLYLLSRVLVGAVRALAKRGVTPFALVTFPTVYPYLAVGVWAAVMGMYEADPGVLHPSLVSSMHEIYREADAAVGSLWSYVPTPATLAVMAHVVGTAVTSSLAPVPAPDGAVASPTLLSRLGRVFAVTRPPPARGTEAQPRSRDVGAAGAPATMAVAGLTDGAVMADGAGATATPVATSAHPVVPGVNGGGRTKNDTHATLSDAKPVAVNGLVNGGGDGAAKTGAAGLVG